TGICSQANSGTGAGGPVTVNAGTLSIKTNGEISTATFGSGNAGSVTVNVHDQLTIDGLGANPMGDPTGIFAQANSGSTGAGGTVSVTAGTLSITNSGQISSLTMGAGDSGNVSVNVSGGLVIAGSGEIAGDTSGTGNAGVITVNAGSLS